MLWCFQTHKHPPRSTQNVCFWQQIHNKNQVQNKNHLNKLPHMVLIFCSPQRKQMWYRRLGSQRKAFPLFFFISFTWPCAILFCLWNSNKSKGSDLLSQCWLFPSCNGFGLLLLLQRASQWTAHGILESARPGGYTSIPESWDLWQPTILASKGNWTNWPSCPC